MSSVARAGRSLLLLGVLLALFGIWFPELHHYSVPSRRPDAAEATRLRTSPADLSFAASARADFDMLLPMSDDEFVAAAQGILDGRLSVPGYATRRLKRLFDPADLAVGTGLDQLGYSGLIVPDVLVRAYQISGDDRYLTAAREFILGWARFERRQLLPKGNLWGDHAVANRALVLTRFWRAYRAHPSWNVEDARVVLEQVLRTGEMLTADKMFTARTNHGVMQNVGLLTLAVAFPDLRESAQWRTVALHRLDQQLAFYVSDEGVVLEHSAGYHVFGVRLLGFTGELMQIAGETIPASWTRKYQGAARFAALLLRPDGSLPAFGDTAAFDVRHESLAAGGSRECSAPGTTSLYPVSAYAIWWTHVRSADDACDSRQLVVVWSHFATEAHKHPDEMSVLFWAGVPWWSSVGYWPYDSSARHTALSWTGSNAPHWSDEPANSERRVRALLSGAQPGLRYLQLERDTGQRGRLARQIVEIEGQLWVVIDSSGSSSPASVETVWNSFRDVTLERTGELSYAMVSSRMPRRLAVALGATQPIDVRTWRGNEEPLRGWIAGQGDAAEVVAVPAISVQAPANSTTVTVWALHDAADTGRLTVSIPDWRDEATWTIDVGEGNRKISLAREGIQLSLAVAGSPSTRAVLQLADLADPTPERARVNDAYRSLDAAYPYFKDLLPWRWQATLAMLICATAAALALWVLQRWLLKSASARRATLALASAYALVLVGFAACATWLVFWYLRT